METDTTKTISIRAWKDQVYNNLLNSVGKHQEHSRYRYQGTGMFNHIMRKGWPLMQIQYEWDTAFKIAGHSTKYELQRSLCAKLYPQVKAILGRDDFIIAFYPKRDKTVGLVVAVSDDTTLVQLRLLWPQQDGVKTKFLLQGETWADERSTT